MTFLARGRPCEGCGVWVTFRQENGKTTAFDKEGVHKCREYEELRRISSDGNLIDTTKTFIALVNSKLHRYRIDYTVRELSHDN